MLLIFIQELGENNDKEIGNVSLSSDVLEESFINYEIKIGLYRFGG